MPLYTFECKKCGQDQDIQLKVEDLGKEHTCNLPVRKRGGKMVSCDGKLFRVYTPFHLRIK